MDTQNNLEPKVNNTPEGDQSVKKSSEIWWVILVLVIVAIIIAIIYYRQNTVRDTITVNRAEQDTLTVEQNDVYLDEVSNVTSSDTISDIEKDLNATDVSSVDEEADNITSEISN